MKEPADLTLSEAVVALENGILSAVTLTEACLARALSEQGKQLNAFIHLATDLAVDEARASDQRRSQGRLRSRLDGIPIAIKDNVDVQGQPTSNGLATNWYPHDDAPVIGQLRALGMIMLGKLNMHEGALGATTDNRHHGRCMHPHFPGLTPGGSSGGSAAAVAGGLCPVTLGTDTMGSVRLPAAYCGIVGLKPSRNFWSVDGVIPLARGLDTIGPLARTVKDIALLLDVDLQEQTLAERHLGLLDYGLDVEVEPACQIALMEAVAHLTGLGVNLEKVPVSNSEASAARKAGFIVSEVDGAEAHKAFLATEPEVFSHEFHAMLTYGQQVSPERYQAARSVIETAGEAFLERMADFDVLVSLTTPQCAFSFDDNVPINQADFTAIANFSGCPAISLPIPRPVGQRPVGLQLFAQPGNDRLLIQIASEFETLLAELATR